MPRHSLHTSIQLMNKRDLSSIDTIVIHTTATQENQEVTIEQIDMWHKKRGWDMVGYHYVVDLQGKIHKGRCITQVGAHVKGHNKTSIGICYVGGLDENGDAKDTLRPIQKNAIGFMLLALKAVLQQPMVVKGHKEFTNKACPCFEVKDKFAWEIEKLAME